MDNQFAYINKAYGLDVKRGSRLAFQGELCKVTSADGAHLIVAPVDEPKRRLRIHPTWEVVYMEGRDG